MLVHTCRCVNSKRASVPVRVWAGVARPQGLECPLVTNRAYCTRGLDVRHAPRDPDMSKLASVIDLKQRCGLVPLNAGTTRTSIVTAAYADERLIVRFWSPIPGQRHRPAAVPQRMHRGMSTAVCTDACMDMPVALPKTASTGRAQLAWLTRYIRRMVETGPAINQSLPSLSLSKHISKTHAALPVVALSTHVRTRVWNAGMHWQSSHTLQESEHVFRHMPKHMSKHRPALAIVACTRI